MTDTGYTATETTYAAPSTYENYGKDAYNSWGESSRVGGGVQQHSGVGYSGGGAPSAGGWGEVGAAPASVTAQGDYAGYYTQGGVGDGSSGYEYAGGGEGAYIGGSYETGGAVDSQYTGY